MSDEPFEEFFVERYERLVAAARMITNSQAVAEDVAQEAFVRAYAQWSKLWPDGNPAAWVYRVATNLALSWRRRLGYEVRALARLGKPDSVPGPVAYPELHREVAALPSRQRAAVALHYTLDLPIEETAEAMGCRPGTVRALLHQARTRLRHRLGEEVR